MCLWTQRATHPCSELWRDLFTLYELAGRKNVTGGDDALYCSRLGFGFLVPSSSESGLGSSGRGATRGTCPWI